MAKIKYAEPKGYISKSMEKAFTDNKKSVPKKKPSKKSK